MLWNEEQKPFFTEATVGASIASQSPELSRPSWDRTQKRMNKCKLKHRSDFVLDDWHKYNHLEGKPEHVRLGSDCTYPINPSIDRVRCNHLSTERFVRQYERTATPVVLTGCADHWMARTNWTFEALLKKLDTAVSLFEQQAVTKVNWVANIELLCWFLKLGKTKI